MSKSFTKLTFYLLTALSLAFIASPSVSAIPVSRYEENLKQAITALDTLTQEDEDETESQYTERVFKTARAIRAAIPENSMIEIGDEIYSVQNGWLHNELGQLEKATPSSRATIIYQLLDQLRALSDRIDEGQIRARVNSDDAKGKLESILRRPEYQTQSKGSGILARLIRDFLRWLDSLLPKRSIIRPERANSLSTFFSYVVLVISLVVIAYVLRILLLRLFRDQKVKHKEKPQARVVMGERIAPEQSSRDLLSEAEQLAREGKLRAAIRKAYIALLLELSDRNAISLAQNKTNHDYLRSVQHAPKLYANLSGITDSFERHWYGESPATEEDWQQFRVAYLATLQTGI